MQGEFIRLFGIDEAYMGDQTEDADLLVAGYQFSNSADTNAIVVCFDPGFTISQIYQQGRSDGTETFRDVVAHDLGFQAIGLRNNEGEGMRSVYISHMDNTGNEYFGEMMGSEYDDQVTSLLLRDDSPVTAFAGRHTGYGINETGNAYLGGVLLQKWHSTCLSPRVLFVEGFVKAEFNNTTEEWEIQFQDMILGRLSKEADLKQFLVDNNFTHVMLYGLNHVFSPKTKASHKSVAEPSLNAYLAELKNAGITAGVIYQGGSQEIINTALYNTQLAINLNNYNQAGKVNFATLDFEFWNAGTGDYIVDRNGITYADPNDLYQAIYDDHKFYLSQLNQARHWNGNGWGVYDYIAKFFANLAPNFQYNVNNADRQAKATELELLSDAIFLYHDNPYSAGPLNFLSEEGNSANYPVNSGVNWRVDQYRERMKLLGNKVDLNGNPIKTNVIPIYYTSWDDPIVTSSFCPQDNGLDCLGRWFEDYGSLNANPGHTLKKVEETYNSQHALAFNNNISGINFLTISNVELIGHSFYGYTCLKDKDFSDKSNSLCPSNFGGVIGLEDVVEINTKNLVVKIFPNPSNTRVVNFDSREKISRCVIINEIGQEVKEIKFNNVTSSSIRVDKSGFYQAVFFTEDNQRLSTKFIIL